MSITKGIPLTESGPNIDRDNYEMARVDKTAKEAKQQRSIEVNDPVITQAVDTIKEITESLGRKIDIEFERDAGLAVITVYAQDGETIIRKVPPEDLIRTAERMKDRRSQYLDDVF
jgi:uncharacterized FlaG/YvyC family protein